MKVRSNLDGAIQQLKQAHGAAGSAHVEIRQKSESFFQRLNEGSAFAESKLKLKLAFSPSSREAMGELQRLIVNTPTSEVHRHDQLQAWAAHNKPLIGWMSADAQKMLQEILGGRGQAKAIDDGINNAEAALAKAFGKADVTTSQRSALKSFAFEASGAGARATAFAIDIDALATKTLTLLTPGAKQALATLRSVLADPSTTQMQKRDAFYDFQQKNPSLSSSLHFGRDLSVADWSDGRFNAAEAALKAAFASAA